MLSSHPQGEERRIPGEDRGADPGDEQPGEGLELSAHLSGAGVIPAPDQTAQPRHGGAGGEFVDADRRAGRIPRQRVGGHDGGGQHHPQYQHVGGEQQLHHDFAHCQPGAHGQQRANVVPGGPGDSEPRHVAPGQGPEDEARDERDHDLRAAQPHEAQSGPDRRDHQQAAYEIEARLQAHAAIPEVHPAQHRFGHAGHERHEEAGEQEPGRHPHGVVQGGRGLGHAGREPDHQAARGGEDGEEQQPHCERRADVAPLRGRVVHGLAVGHHEADRFGGTAVGRRHVGHQPVQHLPGAEQRAPQPRHHDGSHHQAHQQLCGVVEQRRDRVEGCALRERGATPSACGRDSDDLSRHRPPR